jgi:hypothetical protein
MRFRPPIHGLAAVTSAPAAADRPAFPPNQAV